MIDNICALSTPWGRSALALIRVSGPGAKNLADNLSRSALLPRAPTLCLLQDARDFEIDEALVIFFKAPHSYTGEDLVEFSVHGNPAIVEKLIAEIVSRETFRLAEPGEFTRRALANNRLKTDQVESLDLILNSPSINGVRLGLKAKMTGLTKSVEGLSFQILEVLSTTQAFLDFSEEEVGSLDREGLIHQMKSIQNALESWTVAFDSNKHLFNRRVVVLAGPPNSGKSSLFNRLVGSEKAIVYDQPGTTRDFLEHSIDLDGVGLVVIDTAGIRDSLDPIERLGIERSLAAMDRADVVVWVDDQGRRPDGQLLTRFVDKKWLFLHSKSDLAGFKEAGGVGISMVTSDGVDKVKRSILPEGLESPGSSTLTPLTSARQRNLAEAALKALGQSIEGLQSGQYLDMVTEQLQGAVKAVHGIVEAPNNEEVLGRIFSRFCIGK